MNRTQLEDRLIDFAVLIIKLVHELNQVSLGRNISSQLSRSGTSAALNYAESLAAESKRDFIHKMRIVLKELRETLAALKIIERANLLEKSPVLEKLLAECNELVAIFVSSLKKLNHK